MTDLLTRIQAARRLNISLRSLDYHLAAGRIPRVPIGGGGKRPGIRLKIDDLDAFVKRQEAAPEPAKNPSKNNMLANIDRLTRRVDDLLEANNRYLERARAAEKLAGDLDEKTTSCEALVAPDTRFGVGTKLSTIVGALQRRSFDPEKPLVIADKWNDFQSRVRPWLLACFGEEIAADRTERNHRFLEEAIELVQAIGCSRSEAHQLVDYVFDRPEGEPHQEVGGVMVTLAALCLAHGLNMHAGGETELARCWTKIKAIRAKQAAKPSHGPMPGQVRLVRHKKRGSTYRVVGTALLQTAKPVGEACAMVIYRDIDKGHLCARPEAEFDDGRFEVIDNG